MNLRETNARLRELIESLDFDPELDANDVDSLGMDAMTRKRLRIKKLHKHPSQKRAKAPVRNSAPTSLRTIKHMASGEHKRQ